MRDPLFVDTGYLRALADSADQFHDVATRWRRKIREERIPLVTSTGILIELGDGFARAARWARFKPFLDAVRTHAGTEVVTVDADVFSRAVDLRASRPDKDWGLTDCTSFVIMQDRRITAALSCDQHFAQARFRALLLDE